MAGGAEPTSASAGAWPTTWAWARPSRSSPSTSTARPRPRAEATARRSSSARPRCSATGQREIERFAPGVAGPPLPRRRPPRSTTSPPTRSCSPPTALLGAMPRRWPRWRGGWWWPTRPSTPRTRWLARPRRCGPSRPRAASPSPARRSRTASPSCGRSSTGPRPACSARSRRSAATWPCPSSATGTRRRPSASSRLVRPFLLRRRKSDPDIAPDLPPKTETDRVVPLTAEQATLYEAVVQRDPGPHPGSRGHRNAGAWCSSCSRR